MENYEPIEYINTGSTSKVCKIRRKADGKLLVWKELIYGNMTEKEKQQLVSEVNILRELKHPNIVRYYDRIIDKQNQKICIIMEYCEGGDISQLIKRLKKDKESLPEETLWKLFMQAVLALHEIHRRKEGKILHRDIKPANMFLDAQNNLKLGDFGVSKILNENSCFSETNLGTPYYISPEQLNDNKYSEKSDIWSIGCFLYELCSLTPPFEASNQLSLALKIKTGKFERIPAKYSDEIQRVIQWILSKNQEDRPSVDDLLNLPDISLRLREKRLKDNIGHIEKKEEDLKKREETVDKQEMALKARENELKNKEKYLLDLEKKLKLTEEKIKSTKGIHKDKCGVYTTSNSITTLGDENKSNRMNGSTKYISNSNNNSAIYYNTNLLCGKTEEDIEINGANGVGTNGNSTNGASGLPVIPKLMRLSSIKSDENNISENYYSNEMNNISKSIDKPKIESARGDKSDTSISVGIKSFIYNADTVTNSSYDLQKQIPTKLF